MDFKINFDIEEKAETKTYKLGKLTRAKDKLYSEAAKKIEENTKKEENTDDEDYDTMVNTLVKLYDNQFTEDEINENMEVSDIIGAFTSILIYKNGKARKYVEDATKSFIKGK